jgi:hypothetical protein
MISLRREKTIHVCLIIDIYFIFEVYAMHEAFQVGSLLCRLYPLVCLSSSKYDGVERKGPRFEAEVAEQVYRFALESGFNAHPPRMSLSYGTVSGNVHQFDASFSHRDGIFLVECKNTRQAAKDYLYYFNAKILDYAQHPQNRGIGFQGIFVSVVPVAESAWRYALAYGIRVVEPGFPPPELIYAESDDATLCSLARGMLHKISSFRGGVGEYSPQRVLDDYRYLCSLWSDCANAE